MRPSFSLALIGAAVGVSDYGIAAGYSLSALAWRSERTVSARRAEKRARRKIRNARKARRGWA